MKKRCIVTGVNGFGRFGLHLLKYWLDRSQEANFLIAYINDDYLNIEQAFEILKSDRAVCFDEYRISLAGNHIVFTTQEGKEHKIEYTFSSKSNIPWIGLPEIVLECSGKSTQSKDCQDYLTGHTKLVVISATSWDADKTLIYGFNEKDFSEELKVISYGSCTVNAYVPFANFIHNTFGVIDSDVNVIHNVQHYRLIDAYTLTRKFCTLEKSALNFLPFLNQDNFNVNYTVIPYDGVSMIDFRFRIKSTASQSEIISKIEQACRDGVLKGLYSIDNSDMGPEVYNCTTFSTVFIKERIKMIGDSLYLFGYFDNENSVNRYFDLIQSISQSY